GSRPTNVKMVVSRLGSSGVAGGVSQPPGSVNTTRSPRRSSKGPGRHLDTKMRSPVSRVSSIDGEGIQKDCTKKVLMISDSTKAATITIVASLTHRSHRLGAECRGGRC